MNILHIFLFFVLGFVARFFSILAGGGAGLIETPILLFFGIPPQIVVASRKFSAIGGHGVAAYHFQKAKKIVWKVAIILIIISGIASFIGANIMVRLESEILEKIIVVMMLAALPFILLDSSSGLKERVKHWKHTSLGYFLNFGIYIVDSISAVGGGILSSFTLIYLMGMTYLQVSAIRRITGLTTAIVVFVIFWYHGLIDWVVGFSLMAGGMFGSYIGVKVALKKGNKLMRWVFSLFVLIFVIKLLWF